MSDTIDEKTVLRASLGVVLIFIGFLMTISGIYWTTQMRIQATQMSIDRTLLKLGFTDEKLLTHTMKDRVMSPADVEAIIQERK